MRNFTNNEFDEILKQSMIDIVMEGHKMGTERAMMASAHAFYKVAAIREELFGVEHITFPFFKDDASEEDRLNYLTVMLGNAV